MKVRITKEVLDKLGLDDFLSLSISIYPNIFAYFLSIGAKEVELTQEQYNDFVRCYDNQLPYDWDGKWFRGMRIYNIG